MSFTELIELTLFQMVYIMKFLNSIYSSRQKRMPRALGLRMANNKVGQIGPVLSF